MPNFIELRGARTHNLKNIDVDIPLKKITVLTGVSGSGKSSLAFNTLYAEGERRYVESLSTYVRQFLEKMPKPDIDSLENICPAIALEQKNHILGNRSTVATMSELYDCFRLLFSKIGHTYCLQCNQEVRADSPEGVANFIERSTPDRFYVLSYLSPEVLHKKTWDKMRKSLLSAGFERVLIAGELYELSSLEAVPKQLPFLVIDRMVLPKHPASDARLLDALEQAFQHGSGKMGLAFPAQSKEKNESFQVVWFSDQFRCEACNLDYPQPTPQHFSFNSPLGACPSCSGFGYNLELDEDLIVPDKRRTIKNGTIDPFTKPAYREWHEDLLAFCKKNDINSDKRYEDFTKKERDLIWNGDGSKRGFSGIRGCFEELKEWKYKLYVRVFIRRYQSQNLCMKCNGSRYHPLTLAVQIAEGPERSNDVNVTKYGERKNISEILSLPIEKACAYFLKLSLPSFEAQVAKDILSQIQNRLQFLVDVGVGYLTLNRLGKTLSGGECQRINLATQLGNKLCSTLYVLDEPSIGLHAADTEKLISLLRKLRDHGNTLVVVEHDLDMISFSDHIIELGPFAGQKGGEVIAQGPLQKILNEKGCLTAKYLTGVFEIPQRKERRSPSQFLKITGACENNLKNISVEFPLYAFAVVTGLSGSGKTTLVHKTLYHALAKLFRKENVSVGKFQRLYGVDLLQDVVLLDQRPIGKSARSNPATYLKIWEEIRRIYSNQSLSLRRGYGPQYFSFNVDAGRCSVCKGEGEVVVEMHFMADLKLPCEECEGQKFKKNVLEVEYKGKNIYKLLRTTVDECLELFKEYSSIVSKLQTLRKVGLGYLELGQSSTTLSGGESQRLKIAGVLEEKQESNVLYVFDEPTTGLHIDDVKKLLVVLQELVENQNTVIVIEHNLSLIAQADWVIDLGPGGGEEGGRVVASGTPEQVAVISDSLTGQYLNRSIYRDGNATKYRVGYGASSSEAPYSRG